VRYTVESHLTRGYVLKTARKPKIACSKNYPSKSLKSLIKYMNLYIPRNMNVAAIFARRVLDRHTVCQQAQHSQR
jgi:hypothetical protein